MERKFCQSCGMPLGDPAMYGSEADDSRNDDYCIYCYANGAFTEDLTMEEMIDHCIGFMVEYNAHAPEPITEQQARAQMEEYFPKLKRWCTTA